MFYTTLVKQTPQLLPSWALPWQEQQLWIQLRTSFRCQLSQVLYNDLISHSVSYTSIQHKVQEPQNFKVLS